MSTNLLPSTGSINQLVNLSTRFVFISLDRTSVMSISKDKWRSKFTASSYSDIELWYNRPIEPYGAYSAEEATVYARLQELTILTKKRGNLVSFNRRAKQQAFCTQLFRYT